MRPPAPTVGSAAGRRDTVDCVDTTFTQHRWKTWTHAGAAIGAATAAAAVAYSLFRYRNNDANVSPIVIVLPATLVVTGAAALGWSAGWIGYDFFGRSPVCPPPVPQPTP